MFKIDVMDATTGPIDVVIDTTGANAWGRPTPTRQPCKKSC